MKKYIITENMCREDVFVFSKRNLKLMSFMVMLSLCMKAQETIELISGNSPATTQNINSQFGTIAQDYKKSVTIYKRKKEGSFRSCTGTLLNTVNQNGKYYILTAAHCVEANEGEDFSGYFSFNYEALTPSHRQDLKIAAKFRTTVMKKLDEYDIALLEMDLSSSRYAVFFKNVYFSGWSIRNTHQPNFLVSHIRGDLKKIDFVTSSVYGKFKPIGIRRLIPMVKITDYRFNNDPNRKGESGTGLRNDSGKVLVVYTNGRLETPNNNFCSLLSNSWYDEIFDELLIQQYLDPDLTYVSEIPGGYGIEDKTHKIESSQFDLTIQPNQVLETSQMIKLNLFELYQYSRGADVLDIGGILKKEGNVGLKITVSPNNGISSPIVIYESNTNGSSSEGTFIQNIVKDISESDINTIMNSLGINTISIHSHEFDFNVPVTIELKNTGTSLAKVRALKIPGLGYRNAVELFKPNDFAALYTNKIIPKIEEKQA
ncbi:hypothetical protein ABW636_03940 [Aquimarina sp. 2201CG1-2-11]|uniref:hypothetical protein n=1 Tax=Aquimarina discodermiae TaxID=3231043 RepID=UPI0034617D96